MKLYISVRDVGEKQNEEWKKMILFAQGRQLKNNLL